MPDSYDPLVRRSLSSGANKINVMGGEVEIPGLDGNFDFSRQFRQAGYQRHDIQSDVALLVYTGLNSGGHSLI